MSGRNCLETFTSTTFLYGSLPVYFYHLDYSYTPPLPFFWCDSYLPSHTSITEKLQWIGVPGLFNTVLFISCDHQWRAYSALFSWCVTHSFQGLWLVLEKSRLLCWGLKGHFFLDWMIMDSRADALTCCQKEHFIFFNHILTSGTGWSWQHCRWSLAYLAVVPRLWWQSWDPPWSPFEDQQGLNGQQ